jgi:hypothetical protein
VEGAAASSQPPPGGVAAAPIPGGGVTDPLPDDVNQPRGASPSANPLNRDPGYVDPPDDPLGADGARNAPTGGPAAPGSGTTEPRVGAPGAQSEGGEVAVTEDEPQYGLGTGPAATGSDAADPLGVDTASDLSGANLQGAGLSVADSSGLPASGPGLESSPPITPTQPGTDDSGEQAPSSSDDDGMP